MLSTPIYKVKQYLFAIGVSVCLYILLNSFTGFYNPDWVIYERIFNHGSHLKEMGRDFGYLFLNNFFKVFSNSYELFRFIVSLFFIIFTFYFIKGNIFKIEKKQRSFLTLSIFVLALFSLRFSIQIREGIALCILITIFNDLLNLTADASGKTRVYFIVILKFIISYLIHSGTSFFFALFVSAEAIRYLLIEKSILKLIHKNRSILIIVFSLLCAFLANKFADGLYFLPDEIQLMATTYNWSKILYWCFNGILTFFLVKKTNLVIKNIGNVTTKIFFTLINNYLLPFVFLLIFTSILLSTAGGLISTLSRVYNLALFVSLLLLVSKTNKHNKFICIYSIYLIVDQIRIVIEAFTFQNLMYYNGEL